MHEQMRPASKEQAPDPSNNYERSHPEREAGQGSLTANTKATPTPSPDKMPASVANAQDGGKQLNAQDAATLPPQPDHSMMDEEPMGWDQAPSDITNPQAKRQPRTGGKGGTPDVGTKQDNS